MKATIEFADGTSIEAEGTPEEIAKLAGAALGAPQYVYLTQPCYRRHIDYWPQGVPMWPYGYQPLGTGTIFGAQGCYQQNVGSAQLLAQNTIGGLGGSGGCS